MVQADWMSAEWEKNERNEDMNEGAVEAEWSKINEVTEWERNDLTKWACYGHAEWNWM